MLAGVMVLLSKTLSTLLLLRQAALLLLLLQLLVLLANGTDSSPACAGR
jgi:hypothetical protein